MIQLANHKPNITKTAAHNNLKCNSGSNIYLQRPTGTREDGQLGLNM
jgi:hypothetical protein